MKNPLVEKYGKESRWVNYKILTVKGKLTKVPFSPISGYKASSIDPKTWTTYEEAKKQSDNIGIIFTDDQQLIGIDIDHCLTKDGIVHEKKEMILKFISIANTYTEISPSKTGLHLFISLDKPFQPLANKKAPFEIYTKGRYFTFTNIPYQETKEIRTISLKELNDILSVIGYPWGNDNDQKHTKQVGIISLEDNTVLTKMFNSKNGKEIKQLYEGDISKYKNDESSADIALCMHLAFWTGKNTSQIERLWTSSSLGQRDKTQKRQDYRTRTINNAISKTKDVYTPPSFVKQSEDLNLLFTIGNKGDKIFIQNTENMCRILKNHLAFLGTLRYDSFKNTIEINKKGWRSIEDNDAVEFQTRISILFSCFGKVGKDMVYDAMIKVAKENEIDSAADFIKSIAWDGINRLETWLKMTYGTPDDVYHRAVGANWLKGLVKRIIEPGCKFDFVLVLEGEQGTRKSTSLNVLGGDWHVETTMSTDTKDFFMQFQGKSIIEFSEGETLSRTEVKRMKAIITMQFDKYRPPYERSSRDFARRCVFAMTTNQSEYLKDETGNRRWLPVTVVLPKANIEWLQENRNQLLAEAHHRVVNLKETIYEFPEEETMREQNTRRISDPNAELVVDWYFNKLSQAQREEGITIHQVYRDALHGGFVSRTLDKYTEMIIANTLKDVLFLDKKQTMKNGIRLMRWYLNENMKLNIGEKDKLEVEQIINGIGW